MARNTNIDEILFPVRFEPVFFKKQEVPINGFKAITGIDSKKKHIVFSVVSDNYELISNQQAFAIGKEIHRRLFPDATSESFKVFNVIAPKTNSFCLIDIIDKNYEMNIWEQEVYVPFVRIQNSYNKSRRLKFDLGFCRKLCDNGVIFEEGFVTINFPHTKQSLNRLDLDSINVSKLKKFKDDFINKTKTSTNIKLPREYFIPLAAKVLNRNFNLNEKDYNKRYQIEHKLDEFIWYVNECSDKYINNQDLGETAYAFFNVVTDYASNNKQLQAGTINGLQSNCGEWLNLIVEKTKTPEFNWENEIEQFTYINDYLKSRHLLMF